MRVVSSVLLFALLLLLQPAMAGKCATHFNGDGISTTQGLDQSRPPKLKLSMCSMYNGDSCCLNVHQSEIQGAYNHLVDVAHKYAPPPVVSLSLRAARSRPRSLTLQCSTALTPSKRAQVPRGRL